MVEEISCKLLAAMCFSYQGSDAVLHFCSIILCPHQMQVSSENSSLPNSADNFTTKYWGNLSNGLLLTLRALGIKNLFLCGGEVRVWRYLFLYEGKHMSLLPLFLISLLYPSPLSSLRYFSEDNHSTIHHYISSTWKYCFLKADYKKKIIYL